MRISMLLGAAALAVAAPAAADWVKAESKHFVIYGDMPLDEMKSYAERLEKFDAAARLVRSQADPAVGDGNRVHVYVVPSVLDVNRTLFGNGSGRVLGYYVDDVRSPYILTPYKSRRNVDNRQIDPEVVFFHEYTHHLQLQSSNRPLPAWLSEGFAEFLANPIFNEDGSVGLGTPAKDRAAAIIKGQWAPLPTLLEGNAITLGYSGFWLQNYAQGWLLTHYLSFEPSRKGQIDAYVKRIAAGENALAAARASFGDLGKLENELMAYRRVKQFPYLKIDSTKLTIPPVKVAAMSAGAAEAMMPRIYAKTGYKAMSKGNVLKRMRALAAQHPGDGYVLRTLAQAEYDNGNYAEAGRAADAALKVEPNSIEAMLYKGRSLLGEARKTNSADGFKQARVWFAKANRADKDDPEALYLYYRSYRDSGQNAPQNALDALKYAAILAPRDFVLQIRLGLEYLRQGKGAEGKAALEPVAYLPHAVGEAKFAKQAIGLIDGGNIPGAIALLDKEVMKKLEEDRA